MHTGGIIAILLGETGPAAPELYEGLGLLQHRGQDACGIVTCGPKGRFYQMKGNGMVRDVLDPSALSQLVGSMGIGHGEHFFPVLCILCTSFWSPADRSVLCVFP